MATKEKNPPESAPKCPPHNFVDPNGLPIKLTSEGEEEKQRRQALEAKRTDLEGHWRKNEYDAGRLGPVHGDIAGGIEAARKAAIQAAQVDDKEFEQRVAKEAGVFTNIEFRCTKCGLNGDIDVVTKSGVIKECKRNGGVARAQLEKLAKVGREIIPKFAGVHTATPRHNVRSMEASLKSQGMADVEIQRH